MKPAINRLLPVSVILASPHPREEAAGLPFPAADG
jgi:hypothetical protein